MWQGVLASIAASCIFGAIYYLSPWLAPLSGEQIFGWRMLVTLPLTTVWLCWSGQATLVLALLQRVRAHWPLGLGLLLSSLLAGVQLWLFMWAPLHGHALPVSLGYFLLPIAMVLAGRLAFGERLSRWQMLAATLAALGVAWELWRAAGVAWSTWLVVIGYPAYFVLRRWLRTNHFAGHWLDVCLMMPVCMWLAWGDAAQGATGWQRMLDTEQLHWMLPLLGVLSAVALALYMTASRMLPLGLFGLLSYVEPVLLVLAALWMGERMAPGQGVMYAFIGAGVAVLASEGAMHLLRSRVAAGVQGAGVQAQQGTAP